MHSACIRRILCRYSSSLATVCCDDYFLTMRIDSSRFYSYDCSPIYIISGGFFFTVRY
jgi:hypothetical protein